MKIHIDIDCFFVSAHRINNPQLNNIPLAVGGRSNLSIFENKKQKREISPIKGAFTSSILSANDTSFKNYFKDQNNKIRGIITTSSYEAREYGVKTAMPVNQALQLCPNLKVLPPNYPLYHKLSNDMKILLEKEIPLIEQFSIDEFFCDLDGWISDKDVYCFVQQLQNKIYTQIGLPTSVGIASSKWIAKLATNDAKPSGIKLIQNHQIQEYIKDIPISKFPGIGKGYFNKLCGHGIKTLGDIKDKKSLLFGWGKNGVQLYNRINGIDHEPIQMEKEKKSIGIGRTFDPITNRDEIKRRIIVLARHLCFIALQNNYYPQTYALKIKYQYNIKSKGFINSNRIFNELYFKETILKLFDKLDHKKHYKIIQLNITLSNFGSQKQITHDLFYYQKDTKNSKLSSSLQSLRNKFGIDIVKTGNELNN